MSKTKKTAGYGSDAEKQSAKIIGLMTLGWVGAMALMGGIGILYMHHGDHDKGPSLDELTRNVTAQKAR